MSTAIQGYSPTASSDSPAIGIEYGKSEILFDGPLAKKDLEVLERTKMLAEYEVVAFRA